jgi:hypothetical protein
MPHAIISNRDRIFISAFWKELFSLAQVQLCMSTTYHSQSDGQIDRVNQCMETYLRCFVNACPQKWLRWLSLAEFWYNTCFHTSIGRSPFVALYGYSPRHFGIPVTPAASVPDINTWLQEHQLMTDLVKQHLNRACVRMKSQAGKGRSESEFMVGDLVFLKLQPYLQFSLAPHVNQKLSFKFFGPFEVLQRVGTVAYMLKLPSSSTIHHVFHASQLKKAMESKVQVIDTLPTEVSRFQVSEKILQRRLVSLGIHTIVQVLVKWSYWATSLATWEDVEALQQRFP